MSWGQNLVNANMELNRAMFEMNRKGHPKNDPCYKEKPDETYILKHMKDALKDLQHAIKELDNALF